LAGSFLGLILATAEIPRTIITERKRDGSLKMTRKMDGEYANTTIYYIYPDSGIVNIGFTSFFCYPSFRNYEQMHFHGSEQM